MTVENALDLRLVGRQARDPGLMRPSEEDPVSPRMHVQRAAVGAQRVIDLRLGRQDDELPLDRDHLLVPEQRPGSQPGAVHDHLLLEAKDVVPVTELPDDDAPPGDPEGVEHGLEIDGSFHEERPDAAGKAPVEGMIRG